jgi:N-acetyl-gamma-glutamyl-phosphate reductase
MKTAVVGASGYAGGELLRLLSTHPKFKLSYIAAGSNAGEQITNLHPQLSNFEGQSFEATEVVKINSCELVFIALPHGESAKLISQIDSKVKIVDLGADFRLTDSAKWQKYYGGEHSGSWVYGLPELTDHKIIATATRVANPGCYATAIALSIAPALAHIDTEDILAVAASGTTGAGRSAKVNLLGSEVMNNLSSYKFGGAHQHTPEIEQVLNQISSKEIKLSFTPILAPMPRGILATVTAKLTSKSSTEDMQKIYHTFFSQSKFVSVLKPGAMPMTSAVLGSNNVQMQVMVDSHVNRILISTAIDNLGKGAAGQAIQNANLMTGQAENAGLEILGVR